VTPSIRRCLAAASVILLASSGAHAASAPETPTSKLASLDADRRVIATKEIWLVAVALEAYAVDHNAYPVLGPEPLSTGRLARFLVPAYLPAVPAKDPWCSDYLYWSSGTDYIIVSYSSDAASDLSYSQLAKQGYQLFKAAVCTGSSEAAGADIVFADGMFCRWHGEKPTNPWP
jgi:hypothetical protein